MPSEGNNSIYDLIPTDNIKTCAKQGCRVFWVLFLKKMRLEEQRIHSLKGLEDHP